MKVQVQSLNWHFIWIAGCSIKLSNLLINFLFTNDSLYGYHMRPNKSLLNSVHSLVTFFLWERLRIWWFIKMVLCEVQQNSIPYLEEESFFQEERLRIWCSPSSFPPSFCSHREPGLEDESFHVSEKKRLDIKWKLNKNKQTANLVSLLEFDSETYLIIRREIRKLFHFRFSDSLTI